MEKKISMESKTFARTSARRYQIVDVDVEFFSILYHVLRFKSVKINITNQLRQKL
jgi:hypothetical protein